MLEKTIKNDKYRIEIHTDENPESPRNWENLGKMVCFHKRYDLGDKHDYDHNYYDGWEAMEKDIIKKENVAVILPLYLYDHSGITISTSSFNDRWDSGMIGFIYMTKKDAIENYGKKIMTPKVKERALKNLEGEVETYDQYLTGDVYGFKVFEDDEETDSCWGFYGDEFWKNGMEEYIDSEIIEALRPELEKEFGKDIV